MTINPLSCYSAKWSNTLKQLIGCYRRIHLSVFDHFVWLARPFSSVSIVDFKQVNVNWAIEVIYASKLTPANFQGSLEGFLMFFPSRVNIPPRNVVKIF